MKKYFFLLVLSIPFVFSDLNADLFGNRTAFPTYTRALRVHQPRIIVVNPVQQPQQLSQEQNPQEVLAQRQITEQETKALQERIAQKSEEARVASYSHMYGASEYGYTDQYHR